MSVLTSENGRFLTGGRQIITNMTRRMAGRKQALYMNVADGELVSVLDLVCQNGDASVASIHLQCVLRFLNEAFVSARVIPSRIKTAIRIQRRSIIP